MSKSHHDFEYDWHLISSSFKLAYDGATEGTCKYIYRGYLKAGIKDFTNRVSEFFTTTGQDPMGCVEAVMSAPKSREKVRIIKPLDS